MTTHIKHNDLEIPKDNPFLNCKLNRKPYAEILTEIVSKYKDGFVLALNNEWGTGKTTFVKMWRQYLNSKGFKTLYFNSWEIDYEEDAFIAIISELGELKIKDAKRTFNNVIKSAVPLSKSILLIVLKKIIDKYVGANLTKEVIGEIEKEIGSNLKVGIKSYKDRKKNIKSFKDNLTEYIRKITDDKPIIFFVDEIDRCRPNFAVEVMEKIKHLFSVEGIVFVLSIDKKQLSYAIRGYYGSEQINAEEYLRRFIDIEYSLPKPDSNLFCSYLYDYFNFDEFIKSNKREKYSILSNERNEVINFSSLLFDKMNLPLRLQEKIFAHARLSLILFRENQYLLPPIFIFLIYLKQTKTDLYNKIVNLGLEYQELINQLDNIFLNIISDEDNKSNINMFLKIEIFILNMYHLSYSQEINPNASLYKSVDRNTVFAIKSRLASKFKRKLESYLNFFKNYEGINIKYLTNKIDLTDTIKLYD